VSRHEKGALLPAPFGWIGSGYFQIGDRRLNSVVEYSRNDEIATLRIDDGKANALSAAVIAEINDGLDRAAREARALVIRGREGVFSGGFDLKVIRGSDEDLKANMRKLGMELLKRLYLSHQPIIFAVTGHAVAMGALLILAGDWRVGVSGEFRIGLNETSIGSPLPIAGLELARDRLEPTALQRATINAEQFSPANAAAIGYLDQVVEMSDFDSAVMEAATRLGALDPGAFAETKRRVRQATIIRIEKLGG
jgi:enoyl-CoA hydratase